MSRFRKELLFLCDTLILVVVGAGAVVTRSFPEGRCAIAGNPARKIRDL